MSGQAAEAPGGRHLAGADDLMDLSSSGSDSDDELSDFFSEDMLRMTEGVGQQQAPPQQIVSLMKTLLPLIHRGLASGYAPPLAACRPPSTLPPPF